MNYVPNVRDAQQTPLYDTFSQAAGAVANKVTFFDSRTVGANGIEITNLKRAGQIVPPEKFTCYGMAFSAIGMAKADLVSLIQKYAAKLIVGRKEKLVAPLDFWPNPGGITGTAATTATSVTIENWTLGQASAQAVQAIAPELGIPIEASDSFSVELVGASGFTAGSAVFLRCFLIGVLEYGVS